MIKRFSSLLTVITLGISIAIGTGLAKDKKPEQITIQPKGKMSLDLKSNQITFHDDVEMKEGQNLLKCDILTIFLKAGAKIGKGFDPQAVDKIVAKKEVSIKNLQMLIEADSAVYTLKDQKMVFEGNPAKVTKDGSVISATKIVYDKAADRIDIDPNGLIEINPENVPDKKSDKKTDEPAAAQPAENQQQE